MRLAFIKLLQSCKKQTFLISFNGSASKTYSNDKSSQIPGYDINLLNQHLNLNIKCKSSKFGMDFYQYVTEIAELPNILIHDLQCSLSDKILAGTRNNMVTQKLDDYLKAYNLPQKEDVNFVELHKAFKTNTISVELIT